MSDDAHDWRDGSEPDEDAEPTQHDDRVAPPEPVILATREPLPLERRRLPDDVELASGAAVVGTYLFDQLIARSVADETWSPDSDGALLADPRQLLYVATPRPDGTLYATLQAVIPASAIPREPWQPEPEQGAALLLGVVVRLAGERRFPGSTADEAMDHFAAILGGAAEPVVDRLLRGL